MAQFEDEYAQLFGEQLSYDPIDVAPAPRTQAIRVGLQMSSPGGTGEDYGSLFSGLESAPPAEEGGVSATDYARAFGSGAVGLGGTVAGIPEYLGRQSANISRNLGGSEALSDTLTDVGSRLATPRRALNDLSRDIAAGMSPEAMQRMTREWTTLDPGKTIWQGGVPEFLSSLSLQATQAVPSSLATLLPGALMLRAGLRGGAIAYLGASEGALSVGQIANNIAEEIEQAPEAELMGSERYRELRQQMSPAEAREQLIGEAQGAAPAIGGTVVGLISSVAGRYLDPKITDVGGGIVNRFTRGFTSESGQEAAQSSIEQLAQNYAAQTFDQSRSLMQGVPEQAVQGGAIGGLLGGVTNAAVGPRRQALPQLAPTATPAQEQDPAVADPSVRPEPTASFGEVFGAGGPAPQGPADFQDVFTMPDRTPPSTLEELQARERYVQNPQAALQRRSALGDAIVSGHVSPDLMAAANARQDGVIQDMFGEQPNPMAGPGGSDMQQVWMRNQQMDLPQATTDLVPAEDTMEQGVLPLRMRERGAPPQAVGAPMPAQPLQEDLTPPEGYAGVAPEAGGVPGRTRADMLRQRAHLMQPPAPTFRDENQLSLPDTTSLDSLTQQVSEAAQLTGDERFKIMLQMLQQPGIAQEQVQRIAQQFSEVAGINAEGFTPEDDTGNIVAPDEPSAEPLSDLLAQLEDLRDPDSQRMGVYLSRANLESLRNNGTMEQVRGTGVPLANFDRKGGTLIAKNRQAAEALLAALGKGTPLQEVLGVATGAGVGKALGANVVVQQRDEKGNVIRESLVDDDVEADALAEAWEQETGQPTFITSAVNAQRRRQQLLKQEARGAEQNRETKRVGQRAEEAIVAELGEGPTAERVRRVSSGALSENQSARNIVQLARSERRREMSRRFGDIDAPESLEFSNPKQAEAYTALYNEYAGQEVMRQTAKDKSESLKSRAKQEELAGKISALREVAKPVLRSEKIARVASRISPEETTKIRREAEQKARPARTARDYTSEVPRLTDEQIDVLPEDELTQAFAAAAKFVAGRKRARKTFEELVATYAAPSEQRKLVKRVQNFLRRKEHGGKVKAVPLTRTAENKGGSALPVRKGKFDTRVLSVEAAPRELAQAERRKIAERAKKAFRHLEQSIHKAGSLLDKTRKGDFASIAGQREPNGDRTEAARKMILGRAYLRTLAEYGNALQKANNRSAPSAIAEVEKFNELLDKIAGYDAKEFSAQLAKLYLAETREAVTGAAKVDPKALGDLVYPNRRAEATAKSVQRNAERLARIARIEQHWNTDGYYRNQVSPLMQKFVDSIARTGYMSYVPEVRELRSLQFAMRLWRAKETTRENLYRPIKRFFAELGLADIDQMKLKDDFQWEVPDITLERKYRRRFGSESADTGEGVRVAGPVREERTPQQQVENFATDIARERAMLARDTPLTPREVEKFSRVQAVNTAIKELRKTIQNGTTLDLIRGEETFVRQMSELGMWSWTNKRLGLGQVTIPGLLRDRTSSVRLVAPRLRNDQMTVREARDTMLELYQPVPLSKEVAKETASSGRAALKSAKRILSVEDEIAERLRIDAMTPEQRRLMEAFNRRDKGGANLNLLDAVDDRDALFSGAASMAARIEDDAGGFPTAHELLDRALAALPQESRFRGVLEKLRSLPQLAQVHVGYDRSGSLLGESIGRYKEVKQGSELFRIVQLNRAKLDDYRAKGHDPATILMHTLTHELVHAATMGAIESNSGLRMATWALMRQTSSALKERGVDPATYYGFRDNDPREFIAEAFSNAKFQRVLRNTYIEPEMSVWQAILKLVKRVLGLPETPDVDNVLDTVLAMSEQLFTGQPYLPTRGVQTAEAHMKLDETVRETVSNVMDKYIGSDRTVKSLWQQAKDRATSGLLPATSMEQMRDTYARHFQQGGKNALADYMRAFFKRNADNSANLETADKLSRKWTELTERNREASIEMSRLMTEATLHQMHPDVALTDEENAHLKDPAQHAKHKELQKRFDALPEEVQDFYQDLSEYYDSTLRREVALMTLNALRGYLTHGKDAPLTESEFDYTEGDVEGMGLNTMEGLREEFGSLISAEGLKLIHNISSMPQVRKGPYFPLMRFGDFVVYAEREVGTKTFEDFKMAMAFRSEQLAKDPTLDVSVRKADHGGYVAKIVEKEFRAAESRTEAENARQEMIRRYGEANTSPVQLKADLFRNEATIQTNAGLKTILGKLDGNPAAQSAIKNFYLQSLADRSFRKHELSRKNRRGVDYDLQHRTFANYSKAASYYTSQLRFGWQMADALRAMERTAKDHRDESDISAVRMGEIVREVNARDRLTHDMHTVSKLVRGGVELGHFMLLTSPSYWMINATQPYMVTLPWLAARSSVGDATTALVNAQKLILSPLVTQAVESWGGLKALKSKTAAEKAFSVLEQVEKQIRERGGARAPEYLKMLTDLKRESIIDLSFIAELRDIASGKQSTVQNVLDASRIMAHLTEVNNRIMTALASYDIGRAKGMEHDSAVEFAKQAVSLTQFNYSSGNKPRLFQAQGPLGSLGPLVFQFMQYPQHMYSLLISNMRNAFGDSPEGRSIARKTLAGIFATHLAAGGVIGAMLQPIKWAMGLAAFMFGDDDEPYDFDRSVREIAASLFGTELGEIASAGLPRAVGVDLSQRMSLGTLYMVDLKTDNADSFLGSLLQSFGGPITGMAANAFRGAQYARDGEWQKAFETIEPKFLRDISKTLRYTSEGLTDATGKTILEAQHLSPYQLFLQSIGLQPSEISETYSRNQARKDAQQHDLHRRESLLKRFRNSSTDDQRRQIAIEISEFNRANPEAVITRSAMLQSLTGKAKAERRMQTLGGNFTGRQVLYATRGQYADVDEDTDGFNEE